MRNDFTLVSVIIPTYNRRHFLAEAVQSCIDQSYSNIEIVIVDDGSNDDTAAYAGQLQSRYGQERVKYYKKENGGASSARNAGLSLSGGKYVQFLDSDDLLLSKKIDLQVQHLDAKLDEVACSCFGVVGNSIEASGSLRRIGARCSTSVHYIKECLRAVHAMPTCAPLWRKSFLECRAGWREDIGLGDDLEYHIRLLAHAPGIGFVPQELFFVREHPGPRLSDARNCEQVLSSVRTYLQIISTLRKNEIWDKEIQKSILRTAATVYANTLRCKSNEEIEQFETILLTLRNHNITIPSVTLAILLKRLIGKNITCGAIDFYVKLKRRFT